MWRLLFLLSLRFLTKCGYATFSIVIINVVITLVTFSDGTKKPTDLAPPKKPNNDDDMVIIIPCELLYKNTLNPSLISLSALLILIAPTPDK